MSVTSYNNIVICEPYKGARKVQSKVTSGFASVEQKSKIVGLKVLVDSVISEKLTIKAGDVVYLAEERLFIDGRKPMNADAVSEEFITIGFNEIILVKGQEYERTNGSKV